VHPDNHPACRLYERNGFERNGQTLVRDDGVVEIEMQWIPELRR
jgi:RimJ/RimL family protein N-acetyltransferase